MSDQHSPIEGDHLAGALACLEAYGADRAHWPLEARALFDEASNDVQFKSALREAALLDEALAEALAPKAGDALQQRIMKDFASQLWRSGGVGSIFRARGFGRLIPAGALAGLSALGFVAGAASAVTPAADEYLYYSDATNAVVFREDDAFWGEIE